MRKTITVAALAAMVLSVGSAMARPTAEQKCQAGKNNAASRYAACIAKAETVLVLTGDGTKYSAALVKCEGKLVASWGKLETAGGTACPSTGDQSPIQDFVDACVQSVAAAVAGGALGSDPVTCNADLGTCTGDLGTCNGSLGTCNGNLTTCETDLAACAARVGSLKTGQTTPYGAGSDGNVQAGAERSFTDNGDGTITDNTTGLMWEKKDASGGIHDQGNDYTWSTGTNDMDGTLVTDFLATLNGGGGFAGHTDWRVPNRFELDTLTNLETESPATYSEFNSGCAATCTVFTCSCTRSGYYWSSSTYRGMTSVAWVVSFIDGHSTGDYESYGYAVRAVRAGY